jgi:heme/copper-type cytochrome/quinol oxidase subunit 3
MTEAVLAHSGHTEPGNSEVLLSNRNQKLAMWLFLASEVVIFSVFIAFYIVFRFSNPELVSEIHGELGIVLVSVNTFLLLMSSWAMVMGLLQIQRGDRGGLVRWIGLTALLGIVFLGGQYLEYSELAHLEISLQSDFGMRFYVPTFFHGVHVLVGVVWALMVVMRGRAGHYDTNPIGVEIFGLYWHFVDVVWIILFTLIYLV